MSETPDLGAVASATLETLTSTLNDTLNELDHARITIALLQAQNRTSDTRLQEYQRRLQAVFEEIEPDAIADQLLGDLGRAGHHIPPGYQKAVRWVVASTIRRVSDAISLSLASDPGQLSQL